MALSPLHTIGRAWIPLCTIQSGRYIYLRVLIRSNQRSATGRHCAVVMCRRNKKGWASAYTRVTREARVAAPTTASFRTVRAVSVWSIRSEAIKCVDYCLYHVMEFGPRDDGITQLKPIAVSMNEKKMREHSASTTATQKARNQDVRYGPISNIHLPHRLRSGSTQTYQIHDHLSTPLPLPRTPANRS